jgi:hypothetical protein
MSTNFPWVSKIFKACTRKANQAKHRSFSRHEARPKVELLEDRVVPTTYAWLPTAAGTFDWNNPANWTVVSGPGTTFPNAQDDVAQINSALTGAETINLNTNITVGTLDIGASSGTNAFTIAPNGGSLALSSSSGTANVSKTSGGADQITAPVTFSTNVEFDNSLSAPNTLAITSTTTGNETVTVNSSSQTGEVDFTASPTIGQ